MARGEHESGRFHGKVAVVTGGNSGIGLASARGLVAEGARVVLFGREQATLDAAVRELGPAASGVRGDVARLPDLERLFAEVEARHGGLDVLIANAGVGFFVPAAEVDEAHFDLHFDVNVKGLFFTVQKALPLLREGASVVLVASAVTELGMAGASVYSATKAAVRSLARTLSAELVGRGIRVNVASPGPIETPIFARMGLSASEVEATKQGIAAQVPLGRMGRAEEAAAAVLFLASDASSYVVGTELFVDGGLAQV